MQKQTEWVASILLNDESSSDQELVNYFTLSGLDGTISPEKAKALVELRGHALKCPVASEEELRDKIMRVLEEGKIYSTDDGPKVERWVEVNVKEWDKVAESDREILLRNDKQGIRFVIREHLYNKGAE